MKDTDLKTLDLLNVINLRIKVEALSISFILRKTRDITVDSVRRNLFIALNFQALQELLRYESCIKVV